jgi:hypothetical protein
MSKTFGQILTKLKTKIDPSLIRQREGWRDRNGNTHYVDYVEWHTVADILDDNCPQWQSTVKDIRQIGDVIAVTVVIEIDGVSREGIGTGSAESELGIKKAEHDALKRAAVKFGVARELYKKETEVIERAGGSAGGYQDSDKPPTNPTAGDTATSKQIGMIRGLAREQGYSDIELDEMCAGLFDGATLDAINKKAASFIIKRLQEPVEDDEASQMPIQDKKPSERISAPANDKPASNAVLIKDGQANAISNLCAKKNYSMDEIRRQFFGGKELHEATFDQATQVIAFLNKQ